MFKKTHFIMFALHVARSERGAGRWATLALTKTLQVCNSALCHIKTSNLIKVVDKLPQLHFHTVNLPRDAGCSAKSLPSHFRDPTVNPRRPGTQLLSPLVTICLWISSPSAAPPPALFYQHSKKKGIFLPQEQEKNGPWPAAKPTFRSRCNENSTR